MFNIRNIRNMLHKIFQFGPYLALSNLVVVYGQNLLSNSTIRRISDDRNHKIQQKLIHLLQHSNLNPTAIHPKTTKTNAIWVCVSKAFAKIPTDMMWYF